MLAQKRVVVVMPAYNAERTLAADRTRRSRTTSSTRSSSSTTRSRDAPSTVARALGIARLVHPQNRGYGGNQKTCYTRGAARAAPTSS